MAGLLPTTRGALIREVAPYTVHGQPHYRIFYSPAGEEGSVYEARLGSEALYEGIAEGDQVVLHIIMNMVTRIETI